LSVLFINFVSNKQGKEGASDIIISFIVGCIFALGLLFSGMTRRSKVIGFLTFNKHWDPSLMFVMGGAVLGNLLTFNYILRIRGKPIMNEKFNVPTSKTIDAKLIVGSALFGLGWGLGGICPGPAFLVSFVYFPLMMLFYMPAMILGQYVSDYIPVGKVKTN
jgi:uncharacterized membrane protein YedE/YeeE